ncbi:hypothetical protein CDO73_00565 [Saccharibacillus sp. O23]|nr:hypothetical protein [Saccharibacillus sp. O23]OWR33204.1 hypothetical protein CDO73_00565 [Saccharibacillus sp. O23]
MNNKTQQAVGGVGGVLGTITSSGLKLDDFKYELKDYLVAELPGRLTLPARKEKAKVLSSSSEDSEPQGFEFENTEIEEANWQLANALKAGDRVLAIRILGGNEVVVICKVVTIDG